MWAGPVVFWSFGEGRGGDLCRVVLATRAEEDQQDAEHGEENKHAGRRTVVFTMRVMQPRVVPPPLRRVVRVVGARRRAADVVRGRAREAAVRAATIVALGIAGIGATVCDSRAAKRLAAERAAALARRALVRLGAVPAGRAALLALRGTADVQDQDTASRGFYGARAGSGLTGVSSALDSAAAARRSSANRACGIDVRVRVAAIEADVYELFLP
jgi:hypothetical protein